MDKFKLALLATIAEEYSLVEWWADIIPNSPWRSKLSDAEWKEVIADLTALESEIEHQASVKTA